MQKLQKPLMITADLLKRRLKKFWGYGSLDSPVWLIGMEEGLGPISDVDELEKRFRATDGKVTVDIRLDMESVPDHIKWFKCEPTCPIQSTLKYPIALHLYLKNGLKPTQQDIRKVQGCCLADVAKKETATIDLLPLPSRNTSEATWLYKNYDVPGLISRREYLVMYKPKRVLELKELIKKHEPKLIIFYSIVYKADWIEVIGEEPQEITPQMSFVKKEATSYCILPQGAAFGMSYERLYEFAAKIRPQLVK